jgi:hypothetical protein
MKTLEVECYAGYRGAERPLRLKLSDHQLAVEEVEDRWYSPGETYFRVRVRGGDHYVLKHIEAKDIWIMEAYRSAAKVSM